MSTYTFRGKRGEQGIQGPAGASDFAITVFPIEATPGVSTKAIEIFTSSPATGTIQFWGWISYDASALNTTTITPEIQTVAVNAAYVSKCTTALGQFSTIPVGGSGAIVEGDTFELNLAVTGGGTVDINTGVLFYTIV